MTRKVISILCYVAAGFFFYATCLLGFVQAPSAAAKWAVIGVFLVPALILLGSGLASSPNRRWKRDVGIVLTSSVVFSMFVILSASCIFMEPEFQKMARPEQIAFFSDYTTGVLWIGLLGTLGGVLLYSSRERR